MTPARGDMMMRAWEAARAVLGVTLGAAEPVRGPFAVEQNDGTVRIMGPGGSNVAWAGDPLAAVDLAERLLGAALSIIQGAEYREGGDA